MFDFVDDLDESALQALLDLSLAEAMMDRGRLAQYEAALTSAEGLDDVDPAALAA